MKLIFIIDDQGGGSITVEKHDVSCAIRSQMKHHEPLVVIEVTE